MLDDFVVRALLGGLGVAALAGPLGCFVVWRRMAYFGNALAHSALLGIAVGVLLSVDLTAATIGVCLAFAGALVLLQRQRQLATDTLLGILAHTALALGLIALGTLETVRVDLSAYLFGDVLAIDRGDLLWILAGGAAVLAALAALWAPLLNATVHQELAQAEGVAVGRVQAVFMLLMAVAVAVGMKIVGILLIVSLLIVPAAAARQLARSPEQMALLAALAGMLAVVLGLGASLTWDTPAGPSIVVGAALLFFISLGASALGGRRTPHPSPPPQGGRETAMAGQNAPAPSMGEGRGGGEAARPVDRA